MIINLFSIFDPSLNVINFYSWMIVLFFLLLFSFLFWINSRMLYFLYKLIFYWSIEIGYVLKRPAKGVLIIILIVFTFLIINNFIALFPFIFSITSHLVISFPLAYVFWLRIIIFTIRKSLYMFLAHLVPLSTPLGLIRFIVIVELLRNLVRPLALCFRLVANMIAGHLLISLLGRGILSLPILIGTLSVIFQLLLVFIEIGVRIIQAYVFSVLLLLYFSER